MDVNQLIEDSRNAIARELAAIRPGAEPQALPRNLYGAVYHITESADPQEIAQMIATGEWGIINRYTCGKEETKVMWALGHVNPDRLVRPCTTRARKEAEYATDKRNPVR